MDQSSQTDAVRCSNPQNFILNCNREPKVAKVTKYVTLSLGK